MTDTTNLQSVLADLIQRMGDAAAKYGPDAIDAAGQYLHIRAIFELVFCFIVLIATLYGNYRLIKYAVKEQADEGIFWVVIVIGLVSIGSMIEFFSPSTWVAALSSRLALVQLAVDRVQK